MPFWSRAGGGAGSPQNINSGSERFGHNGTGGGTTITSHATVNLKGEWMQLNAGGAGGALENDLAGFEIYVLVSGGSSTRGCIDIGIGADSLNVTPVGRYSGSGGVENLWTQPGTGGRIQSWPFLLNLSAGDKVWGRWSANGGSATCQVHGQGRIRSPECPPCYDYCEALVPGAMTSGAPTSSLPQTGNINVVATADTGWTTFKDPTARAYGALTCSIGMQSGAATQTTSQAVSYRIGLGGSGPTDADWIHTCPVWLSSANPMVWGLSGMIFEGEVPQGERVAVELLAAVNQATGANNIAAAQIWGHFNS